MVAWLPVRWPQRAGQAQTLGPALLGLRGQGSHGLPEPRVHTQGLRAHRPISRTKPGDGRAGAGQGAGSTDADQPQLLPVQGTRWPEPRAPCPAVVSRAAPGSLTDIASQGMWSARTVTLVALSATGALLWNLPFPRMLSLLPHTEAP